MMSSSSCLPSAASLRMKYAATSSSTKPWPRSPNMIAKRKGKRTMAKAPGLISRYRGTPYVLTSAWKPSVNLVDGRQVGGVSDATRMLSIDSVSPPAFSAAVRSADRTLASASVGTQPSATKTLRRISKLSRLRVCNVAVSREQMWRQYDHCCAAESRICLRCCRAVRSTSSKLPISCGRRGASGWARQRGRGACTRACPEWPARGPGAGLRGGSPAAVASRSTASRSRRQGTGRSRRRSGGRASAVWSGARSPSRRS